MNKGRRFLGAFLLVAGLLLATACGQVTPEQLDGILQNVNSISGEVTITLKDGGTVTINLRDVGVETLQQAVGSASLEPGAPVTLERNADKKVTKLKAHAAEIEGVITALDQTNKTVTIDEEGDKVTLTVTEKTEIEMDDDGEVDFAQLQVGQTVEAKYNVETKEVFKIEVEEEENEDDEEGEEGEVKGTITAVNAQANMVTIRSENGVEDTYKVTPETELEVDGVGIFANLKPGMKVKGEFDRATKVLAELEAEEERGGSSRR